MSTSNTIHVTAPIALLGDVPLLEVLQPMPNCSEDAVVGNIEIDPATMTITIRPGGTMQNLCVASGWRVRVDQPMRKTMAEAMVGELYNGDGGKIESWRYSWRKDARNPHHYSLKNWAKPTGGYWSVSWEDDDYTTEYAIFPTKQSAEEWIGEYTDEYGAPQYNEWGT